MYQKEVWQDRKHVQTQESKSLTIWIKLAENAAVRILSVISLLFSGFPLPLYVLAKPLNSYISKGSEEKSKLDPKIEKHKSQNECSLKKINTLNLGGAKKSSCEGLDKK